MKHDITLVPSLHEIPENVLESYKGQVAIARRNWRERLEAIKRQKELEEEIERLRAENKSLWVKMEDDFSKSIVLNPDDTAWGEWYFTNSET